MSGMARSDGKPVRSRRHAGRVCRLLGRRIREHRLASGLTQEQLAVISDLHPTYISSLESGRRNPTLNVLVALSGALKTPLAELVADLES